MANRNTRIRSGATKADLMDDYLDARDARLLDALAAATALVAQADGWVDPVEKQQLLMLARPQRVGAIFSESEILDAFDTWLRHFTEPGGVAAAVDSLGSVAAGPQVRLVAEGAKQVALADGYLHPREERMLQLIRAALEAPPVAVW
jgi:tellurite resistance protein